MKRLTIILSILLSLSYTQAHGQTQKYDPFELSSQRVQDAITFGKNADYRIDAFGNYDLGLNKFALNGGIGYVVIPTPFVEIATMARKLKNLQEDFNYLYAKKLTNYPPQIRVLLYVNENYSRTRVDCVLLAQEELFVLSDDVLESTICDPSTGKCVRSLIYFIPVDRIRNETQFTLVLKNLAFGQKNIRVDLTQIK